MAIKLNDFMGILKREGRYGSPSVTTDTATTDILNSINMRGARIWGAADWKWQREKLAFAVAPGTIQYAVLAASGNAIDRILDIIPYDTTTSPPTQGKPLDCVEIGQFYGTYDQVNTPPGLPTKYTNIGQDANGHWQIIIWPAPSSPFTMSGYAKAVLPTYTLADITANNPILYFPNGVVLDALFNGCMIDINLIQGLSPAEATTKEQAWELKIKHLAGEQLGVASDNSPMTSPLPDYILSRKRGNRRRRGTRIY